MFGSRYGQDYLYGILFMRITFIWYYSLIPENTVFEKVAGGLKNFKSISHIQRRIQNPVKYIKMIFLQK